MTRRKTIEELKIGSLFTEIDAVTPLNFKEVFDLNLLDEEYMNGHSSLKTASRLAARYDEDGVYDNLALALVVGNRFAFKWNAMWEGIKVKYNILENYSMTEEETTKSNSDENSNEHETHNNTITDDGTQSDERILKSNSSGTINTENNGTVDNDNSVYAFDGGSASPVSKENSAEQSTSKENNTNTLSDIETNNNTNKNNRSEAMERLAQIANSVVGNVSRTLTRSGNIGVTTSSQMQEQYLRIVEEFYEFVNILYSDLDSVLTLLIY